MKITHTVTSVQQLRSIIGEPLRRSVDKQMASLDAHCCAIIARSPFVVVGSANADGRVDVSPKGDIVGFVHVLDESTLAIPDRQGNRRADTFMNVLQNPRVGLLFVVPGRNETLRVNGTATIVDDPELLYRMRVLGKAPKLALVVQAEEVFVHCGRCMLRSHLWECQHWPDVSDLPSHGRCVADHAHLTEPIRTIEESVQEQYTKALY